MSERVAIVGGGISGLAYAHVLRKNGFEPVVFEKASRVGGVWAVAYPGVRLQNVDFHYHLSDVPWPSQPDFHPTGEQIRAYWAHAVKAVGLDVRLGHDVQSAEERDGEWHLVTVANGERAEHVFDRLVVASGQYTEGKHRPPFDGEQEFKGWIGTERDVNGFEPFAGKRTVVVGFGKSALDVAALASIAGSEVHHVFRKPRWVLPMHLLGIHATWFVFTRFGSVMMTAWGHPTVPERLLHKWGAFGVQVFWKMLAEVVRFQIGRSAAGTGPEGRKRLARVLPTHPLLPDFRSALAIEPTDYFKRVAAGQIHTYPSGFAGFDADGVRLTDGTRLAADRVVLAIGSERPRFPFLPAAMRDELEREDDGAQLYRHLVHPSFPHVGFAGLNHGFMHVPSVEIGAQWLACLWRGDLELPPAEEMNASIERIRAWKRAHIAFEPSRGVAVNTRYQQYIDILLQDLGVSPYRKLPNVVAEVFGRYGASDYAGIVEEVRTSRRPLRPVPFDA